ncbi:hypothetical protein CHARACLAT_025014 [Characodon lateralis]|uniref:Cadherin domain-containing protein n=1 Tax=Characodon lateralis TaxID=208331 RepID=A0ABU7DBQ8_9TELE|nr:hypothetical protein [Characodon lateralis]
METCGLGWPRQSHVISPEKPVNHIFRLIGPGADHDPKGLFTIDIDTGDVSVSRSLDREAIDSYQPIQILSVVFGKERTPAELILLEIGHLFLV